MGKDEKSITKEIILQTIINQSEDTIYFKDKDSKIILSSRAHSLLWGEMDPDAVIGKTDFDYFPDEFSLLALKDEREIMRTGIAKLGIYEKLIKPDGSIMWLSASKHPLYDENRNIIGTWGTSRDITPLKTAQEELMILNKQLEEANAKLKVLSSKDSLSGLFNQRHFFEMINKKFDLNKERLEDSSVKGFSLILFDIDDFKGVNDMYGHLMGDFTIRHISNIIKENLHINDMCFRYGGDEFAIILDDTNLIDSRKVAEKVRQKVNDSSIIFMNKELKITISIGTSTFNEVDDVNEMIKKADERLYNSKEKGKNRVS